MPIERRTIKSRDEWLAWRKPFVTASQVPALFGCHPYLSALKLYLEKSGVEFEQEENTAMRRGRILEPAVAAAVADDRPHWSIRPAREFFCDPDLRLGATPDFFIDNTIGQGVLQAKTAAPSVFERDWANGSQVPFWIVLQATTEMMLTDSAFGAVAVLCVYPYDITCSVHEIKRHPSAEAKITAAVVKFWDDVQHGREPEPDYGRDAALIKILAPREAIPEKTINLAGNNELPALLKERESLRERMDIEKKQCEEIETRIKFMMRDAAVANGLPDWRITYRTTAFKGYTVEPRESRILRIQRKESK